METALPPNSAREPERPGGAANHNSCPAPLPARCKKSWPQEIFAHDREAPLRAIKTLADWLMTDYRDRLDAQSQESLRLLGGRVDRIQNLIDGVLQCYRVGHTEQQVVPIDRSLVVREIIDTLAVPEHISITVENELPIVSGDPT